METRKSKCCNAEIITRQYRIFSYEIRFYCNKCKGRIKPESEVCATPQKAEICSCGDDIDEEGENGKCWICKDKTPYIIGIDISTDEDTMVKSVRCGCGNIIVLSEEKSQPEKPSDLLEKLTLFLGNENNYLPCRNRECEGCFGPLDEEKLYNFLQAQAAKSYEEGRSDQKKEDAKGMVCCVSMDSYCPSIECQERYFINNPKNQ